jgi:hypothetical protein
MPVEANKKKLIRICIVTQHSLKLTIRHTLDAVNKFMVGVKKPGSVGLPETNNFSRLFRGKLTGVERLFIRAFQKLP